MNDKATSLFGGKRRAVWFCVMLLVVACGLNWYISRNQEPIPAYQGKPLTYWMEGYMPLNTNENSVLEADLAIHAIGTNAIPTLVKMLERSDSPRKLRLIALLGQYRILGFFNWKPAPFYHLAAGRGFHTLGPDGYSAVPALTNLYLRTTNRVSQIMIINAFENMGPAASNAVPFLASLLSTTNRPMETGILSALKAIHSRADFAVPALIKCLNDPSPMVRKFTARTLIWYRGDALSAVPALVNLAHDKDSNVRFAALDALQEIDPKAAAQVDAETNHVDSQR